MEKAKPVGKEHGSRPRMMFLGQFMTSLRFHMLHMRMKMKLALSRSIYGSDSASDILGEETAKKYPSIAQCDYQFKWKGGRRGLCLLACTSCAYFINFYMVLAREVFRDAHQDLQIFSFCWHVLSCPRFTGRTRRSVWELKFGSQ